MMFNGMLTVLLVIAHPDDETLFGGLVYTLTHHLNASVDLACITNGEDGFAHAILSQPFYGNIQLTEESVARTHLAHIRQKELFGSGEILGIRNYFFYDQMDLGYTQSTHTVLNDQWKKEWVIQRFEHTIKYGNGANGYDLMILMLPNVDSHAHHTLSGLLALEAIDRLKQMNSTDLIIPTVIGGSEFVLNQPPTCLQSPLAEVSTELEFRFNLRWKLVDLPYVDYQTILLWMAAEHKTQGTLVTELLTEYNRDNEQYFYFSINERNENNTRLLMVQQLFDKFTQLHQKNIK